MERKITGVAVVLGMTAIILGAFGAHALKKHLTVEELVTFETGVKYQMYHALFLLFLGLTTLVSEKSKKAIFQLVVFGVIFFSGSIYLLATKTITGIDFKQLDKIIKVVIYINLTFIFISLIKIILYLLVNPFDLINFLYGSDSLRIKAPFEPEGAASSQVPIGYMLALLLCLPIVINSNFKKIIFKINS